MARLQASDGGVQQLLYFERDFPVGWHPPFFPAAVNVSSTGHSLQIRSLISTNERLRPWNLRNSAISCSALRTKEGVGKVWVTVFPRHL